MLDTRFPRLPGDIGHPGSFAGASRRLVVPGAVPARVVTSAHALAGSGLLPAFVSGLRQLEREGARALTTSCGFLVLLQEALQAAVDVPLVTSSLLLLPGLLQEEPQVGVLTISTAHLGEEHLCAAGVAASRRADVIVQGVDPAGAFAAPILDNCSEMDPARAQESVVEAATALRRRAPALRTVVLECTNLPPYARAIREATGLRVLDLRDAPQLQPWRRY